ncbi:hypothetical protein [Gramella sp. AN32]|uniref:Uncharacterized protein n=1 Tax=Christiangramia antarctica TaxID=2058158 RepID=A0ABW5XAR4_9FLAO|nr:hypothetical protein [Gramella sp. AN32]MCM4158158.1 hypothetical protein [Gramella sp. AN32]
MRSRLQKEYIRKFNELRVIINSWNLIPDSPIDEFDSINHLLLSQLYKDSDEYKISKAFQFELINNYGFSIQNMDTKEMITEVLEWWKTTNKR